MKVVYTRGKYYITELSRSMDSQRLYRVFVNPGSKYWRDYTFSKYANVKLEAAIEWVNRRVQ